MISIRQLAEETGAARDRIKPWLEAEGISCGAGRTFGIEEKDKKRALAVIAEHRTKRAPKPKVDPEDQARNGTDPKTGLSWLQANLREQTLERRRQNHLAEKLENEEWVATATHHQILGELCGRLEQVPAKCKAELGLTDLQVGRVQKMLDEIRQDAAAAIAEALAKQSASQGEKGDEKE